MATTTIRQEHAADADAIERVVTQAFGRPSEARLVNLIRERHQALMSLVAELEGDIVGHVLASAIEIRPVVEARLQCAGIAPLAVSPEHQNCGIGSLLMQSLLAEASRLGFDVLFLLGSPEYYRRFGFVRSQFSNEYGATEAFQQLALNPDGVSGLTGTACYVRAFSEGGV